MLLRLSPFEIVRLVQAEFTAADGQPELGIIASIEYVFEEDDGHRAKRREDSYEFDQVTEFGGLAIEPRVERDYWILRITFERPLGLLPQNQQGLHHRDLTLDEFDVALRACEREKIKVHLDTETQVAKHHFARWLADMRLRHPSGRGRKMKVASDRNRKIHRDKTKPPERKKPRRSRQVRN